MAAMMEARRKIKSEKKGEVITLRLFDIPHEVGYCY